MKIFYLIILSAVVLLFSGIWVLAEINSAVDLTYPITQLGNCENKDACAAFCDQSENMAACLDFAEQKNLLSQEDIEMGKKLVEQGKVSGPGGCKGISACQVYCDEIAHLEECLVFAEENNLMSEEELVEAKKVAAAVKQGVAMPNCKSKSECDTYCKNPDNIKECITFAEAAGIIPENELAEAKQMLQAIEKGAKPPACGGKKECDIYCAEESHFEECISFAEAAGFVSVQDAAMARKTGGKGPGGCRGKEECETFCDNPDNMETCINFSVENGMMTTEEAEQAKKMMAAGLSGGPGGCRGKEECETYCNELSHLQECMDFSVKAGFMTPEEAEKIKQMGPEGGIMAGPGGCKGQEECEAYCNNEANLQECINFGQQAGMMSPQEAQQAQQSIQMMQQGGPGGCQGEGSCKDYCADPSHLEECTNFMVGSGFMSQQEGQQMMQNFQGPPPGYEGQTPPPGYEGGGMSPGNYQPPEGMVPPEGFQPPEGYTPPSGGTMPPEGSYGPPPSGNTQQFAPPEDTYGPPPGTEGIAPPQDQMQYTPPTNMVPPTEIIPPPSTAPSGTPPPSSFLEFMERMLGSLFWAISPR